MKEYVAGSYYHLYNRGVEKRLVFLDDKDYRTFIGYLKMYLTPSDQWTIKHKDLSQQIEVMEYCLMPNHFHLLVRQSAERGIENLMRCLMTSYVGYFNRRYGRVGSLFQDTYKAVRIVGDKQLHLVAAYILRNAEVMTADATKYQYSSWHWGRRRPYWLSVTR